MIMIGSTILSLPALFEKGGMVGTSIMLVVAGCISYLMCIFENMAICQANTMSKTAIVTLEDVGDFYMGAKGRWMARTVQNISFVGDILCFMVLIGNNMNYMFDFFSYQQWVMVLCVASFSIVFLKDTSIIEKLSFVGIVAPVVYFLSILGGAMKAHQHREDELDLYPGATEVAISVLTTLVYAYGPCDVMPTLRNEMEKPEELPKALVQSHLMVFALCFTMGSIGYFGFGKGAEGNAVLAMCDPPGCPGTEFVPPGGTPGGKWTVGYLLAGVAVTNHLVGLLVNFMCVFLNAEAMFTNGDEPMNPVKSSVMRVIVIVFSGLLSVSLPYFLQVLGIISALVAVPLVVIFPTVTFWYAGRLRGIPVVSAKSAMDFLIVLFAILCFYISMSEAIQELLEEMSKGTR
jgi:amino acid permease